MPVSVREFLNKNNELGLSGGLYVQKGLTKSAPAFESLYKPLREKERRIYADDEIKRLPEIDPTHPLFAEWRVRKNSLDLLLRYLQAKKSNKNILEVGCGNGWLSNRLAESLSDEVCGMDVNKYELMQASRLFGKTANLSFVLGNLWDPILPQKTFDAIILASSMQYFPDLRALIQRLLELNTETGEIHILDSPLYKTLAESAAASNRSMLYFETMGFPLMADHYFHHTFDALKGFDVRVMYNPDSVFSVLKRNIFNSAASPFPWIRLKAK